MDELRVFGRPGRAFGIYCEGDEGLKRGVLISEYELDFPIQGLNCHNSLKPTELSLSQCNPAYSWGTLAGPGLWAQALISSCKGASSQGKSVVLPPCGCGGWALGAGASCFGLF